MSRVWHIPVQKLPGGCTVYVLRIKKAREKNFMLMNARADDDDDVGIAL